MHKNVTYGDVFVNTSYSQIRYIWCGFCACNLVFICVLLGTNVQSAEDADFVAYKAEVMGVGVGAHHMQLAGHRVRTALAGAEFDKEQEDRFDTEERDTDNLSIALQMYHETLHPDRTGTRHVVHTLHPYPVHHTWHRYLHEQREPQWPQRVQCVPVHGLQHEHVATGLSWSPRTGAICWLSARVRVSSPTGGRSPVC